MAKSLRSKIRRFFRTSAGKIVAANKEMEDHQARKEQEQAAIARAPRPARPDRVLTGDAVMSRAKQGGGAAAGAAAGGEGDREGDGDAMEIVDDYDAIVGSTKNPAKIARKLAAHRRAKLKGLHEKETKGGKSRTKATRNNKTKSKKRRR